MSVSLYDLLDVGEDATADEIRSAWKKAIAELDPADRRFRAYNDAATVLLDEEKRTAYDAELAAERGDAAEEPAAGPPATVADERADEVAATDEDAPTDDVDDTDKSAVDAETGTKAEAEGDGDDRAAAPTGPPTWILIVAAGAAVLSLALLIIVLAWPGSLGGASPADQAKRAKVAAVTVEEAADQAVPVVLSYDYRTFDADVQEAESYLTEDFAADRVDLLDNLGPEVVEQKVVVTAVVSGTALHRVSEDGTRAVVVAFIEQESQKGKAAPQVRNTWASLSMVAEGDAWLIDDICTQEDCA